MTKATPVLFLTGDSTTATKLPEKRPESGWGEHLEQHLRPGVRVENHAVNGRSTKSFLDEGRLSEIEQRLQPGDYLLIQFGHNDQKSESPDRYTEPYGQYQENLRRYVDVARQKGAFPVLFSSVSRRAFVGGLIDEENLGDYPKAAREIAEQLEVPFVDMFQKTVTFLNGLGEEESRELFLQLEPGQSGNYPDGVQDNTHFNEKGAARIAGLVAEELRKLGLPIIKG